MCDNSTTYNKNSKNFNKDTLNFCIYNNQINKNGTKFTNYNNDNDYINVEVVSLVG